jgi:hypothetical protein
LFSFFHCFLFYQTLFSFSFEGLLFASLLTSTKNWGQICCL